MFQHGRKELSRIIIPKLSYLFRSTREHDLTTPAATLPAKVNYIVGHLDHIHIVLNDHHRITSFDQPLKHLKQHLYILKMKPGGRFIKDVQCAPGIAPRELCGQFDTL